MEQATRPERHPLKLTSFCLHLQVVGKKLKDTKGGYAQFLRENKTEAKVMEEKEKRVKVLEQSTVKAKSKVGCHVHNTFPLTLYHVLMHFP